MSPPAGDRAGRIAGRQIRRMVEALEHPSAREDAFLSVVAEAELARRLLEAGCTIEFETPTARGRHADFRVNVDGARFYLHVKRLSTPGAGAGGVLSAEVEALAQIRRPVSVVVRAAPHADAAQRAQLAAHLAPFIAEASVGEEIVVRDEAGAWIGAARISAPAAAEHAVIRTGPDAEWDGAVPRAQHLLRKAYKQFMPGASNVICIASDDTAGAEAVETALLGTMVERWDRFPPRGHRVAHGRSDDGFWAGGNFQLSALVAWFPVAREEPGRVWARGTKAIAAEDALRTSRRDLAAERALRRALGADQSSSESAPSPTA